MKFLQGFQGACKSVILLKEEITDEEVLLYTNNKIDIPIVPEKYNIPYSEVLTDTRAEYSEEIPYGYTYEGYLVDQQYIIRNHLYKGVIDNKIVLCLAKADIEWQLGTEIPTSNFDIINMEEIINKV